MNLRFAKFKPTADGGDPFKRLLDIFLQLMTFTNRDVWEALDWMNQLDKENNLTDDEYGMGDFIEDLKKKGYIKENPVNGSFEVTEKTSQVIRKKSLEEIFGQLKKAKTGNHKTPYSGQGEELSSG